MREKIVFRDHHRSRHTRCPIFYGKAWFFDFLSLFRPPATPHSPYDLSRSSAHPRSQKLLRPQRNGHSVVPSGQVHARKKIRKKSSLLVSIQSLHSIHATILLFFFQSAQVFGFCPVLLSLHLYLCSDRKVPPYTVSEIFYTPSQSRQINPD